MAHGNKMKGLHDKLEKRWGLFYSPLHAFLPLDSVHYTELLLKIMKRAVDSVQYTELR